jgi:hypothetical protein
MQRVPSSLIQEGIGRGLIRGSGTASYSTTSTYLTYHAYPVTPVIPYRAGTAQVARAACVLGMQDRASSLSVLALPPSTYAVDFLLCVLTESKNRVYSLRPESAAAGFRRAEASLQEWPLLA